MENCIFCKIVAREIPAEIVYENDLVVALLDIMPVNPGHTLVVPKAHYPDFVSTPEDIVREVASVTHRVAGVLGAERVMLVVDGEEVPHFHQHVIPRVASDGLGHLSRHPYAPGDIGKVAEKIRDAYRKAWL